MFSQNAWFVSIHKTFLDSFKTPTPSSHNEKVIGDEKVKVSEDYRDWLHNIPRQMEVNKKMNDGILSNEEVREVPQNSVRSFL